MRAEPTTLQQRLATGLTGRYEVRYGPAACGSRWAATRMHLPGVIQLELEDLVAAGLTPLAAVTAATNEAARLLGADAEIGTVAVGKRADLILLDADPLVDIRNTRRIRMVIRRGRIVDRDALLQSA